MPEVSRTYFSPKDISVEISEIKDGIYRIAGFVKDYGITFNQFLINDEQPTLIHTGPIGMYDKIEEKLKEVIPLEKLAYVAFLHFESDEWGGMLAISPYAISSCNNSLETSSPFSVIFTYVSPSIFLITTSPLLEIMVYILLATFVRS